MRRPVTPAGNGQPAEIRCAIYTRKSSEEGLEQEFNSLHAQREACEAYIRSQRHEGWRALPTLYDDGGISGGTLDRPALGRLLDDIRGKRIDLVVIYKVDRLTRSLADFAKLVDVFNGHNVSFVSVTQQFNTATSMGRLTLNMLLSFAQFEREVTGERIRDKIAASKRKGMWMGGYPPLGYDVRDRKLVVNDAEAAQVVEIFESYLTLGSVSLLSDQLAADGVLTKHRIFATGRIGGGRPFTRGNLYEMLQNRLYRGEIAHKGHVYPGEHRAIIDSALWDGVQAQLAGHRVDRSLKTSSVEPSLLAGIIYDGEGNRLTPTHSKKGNKRYRYYISHGLIVRRKGEQAGGLRIPAADLERAVVLAIRDLAGSPSELIAALGPLVGGVVEHHRFLGLGAQLYQDWSGLGLGRVYEIVRAVVGRVEAHSDSIRIDLQPAALAGILFGLEGRDQSAVGCGEPGPSYTITVPAKLQRAGQEMRLVVEAAQASSNVDPTLAKLIHQAVRFRDQFLAATREGISELAAREGISGSHYTRVLRLGFLAPDINAAIASGCQPVGLTATKMLGDTRLPLGWVEQRIALGFRPAR